jgi:hypothetical protein
MKVIFEQRNSKLVNYSVIEVAPKIYAVVAPDDYERAMLFCRVQEYYESPFSEFRGRDFCIFEYMNHYRKDRGLTHFSYTSDWAGYNVPSQSIEQCMNGVQDWSMTAYDHEMLNVIFLIRSHQKKGKFYLIGVDTLDSRTMDHELAHGFFYTNKEYKTEITNLVLELKSDLIDEFESYLLQMGYTKSVIIDEIQAYLSTGMMATMAKIRGSLSAAKKFERVFKKYKKQYVKQSNKHRAKRQAAEEV